MTGSEIYALKSKRDYSSSPEDEYAQLLRTLYSHISAQGEIERFFSLLEKAESANKKLAIVDSDSDILVEEYSIDDIILI